MTSRLLVALALLPLLAPVSGRAKVADCSSREDDLTFQVPSPLGVAGFAGANGYIPCGYVTPVELATWSSIKSREAR